MLPCTDQFVRVDLRTVSFEVPPQEVGVLCWCLVLVSCVGVLCWCLVLVSCDGVL